jgi:possible epsH
MTPAVPYITVVMPVYNAAGTVERAIRSVMEQDFSDFLLVVVDDGSTDGTANIINMLHKEMPDFLILSQPRNMGYTAAMTRGIQACPSNYYAFCDADDRMLPGALTALAEAAGGDADMVIAPYIRKVGEKVKVCRPRRDIRSLDDMPVDTTHFALWSKLLRGELLREFAMPFAGIECWGDLGIVARVMAKGHKFVKIDRPVYLYECNPKVKSLSRSSKHRLLADHLAMARELTAWFDREGLNYVYAEFLRHLKFCAKIKLARNPRRNLRTWRHTYPEVNRHILSLRHIPLHYRLLFFAAYLANIFR